MSNTRRSAIEGGLLFRAVDDVEIIDEETRRVRLSFSSELPVTRFSFFSDPWVEVLGHKRTEVDLGRLNAGASVHYNHSRTRADRIGVVERAWLSGHRGEAEVRISSRDDVADVWTDIRDGVLGNVSVGYAIHERQLVKASDNGPDEYRVTRWEPMEISFVDIPADPSVGVGRASSHEVVTRAAFPDTHHYTVRELDEPANETVTVEVEPMDDKRNAPAPAPTPPVDDSRAVPQGVSAEQVEAARKEAVAAENTRQAGIRKIFDTEDANGAFHEVREACLSDSTVTEAEAIKRLWQAQRDARAPGNPTAPSSVSLVYDEADKFRAAGQEALMVRAVRIPRPADFGQNPLRGHTLYMLAHEAVRRIGGDLSGSRMQIIGRAFTTSDDFQNLLADVANKSMLQGYAESPETWSIWARPGNLADFKVARRVGLSSFEDLDLVPEGDEYKYGDFTDRGETIQLGSYGKIFSISRQAIINDDLDALTRVPFNMGRAASRVPGDLAYAVLTTNGLMSDGVALFAAGHSNLGTGGVISAASVGEARNLMALQSDVSGNANGLNIQMAYLLVPLQIQDTARVLAVSEYDPASTTNSRAPNPVRGEFEVVADPRLSADSATQWYAVANGNVYDTVEVGFLDGNQEPQIEEKSGWTVAGIEMRVTLDCGAAALDHRTMVRNAGA